MILKRKNKEKGALEADFATGLVIFIIGSVALITMYVNMYTLMVRLKANQVAIGYITEICEEIDAENYSQATDTNRLNTIISACVKEKDLYTIVPTVTKYKPTDDVVAKISLKVKYTVGNKEMNYTINKIKVKEK